MFTYSLDLHDTQMHLTRRQLALFLEHLKSLKKLLLLIIVDGILDVGNTTRLQDVTKDVDIRLCIVDSLQVDESTQQEVERKTKFAIANYAQFTHGFFDLKSTAWVECVNFIAHAITVGETFDIVQLRHDLQHVDEGNLHQFEIGE